MRVLVINGPNLDLLGTREPETYGTNTLADLEAMVSKWASGMGVEVISSQSNHEGEIIELIHEFDGGGIVLNPGAFTHTSHAIADAIRGVDTPVVETHISNLREREPWRAVSLMASACARTIYGRGLAGYRDAMRHLVNRLAMPFDTVRYGPHPDNVADLRQGGGSVLVVLVHGGLWLHHFERDTVESLAVDLTKRGFDTLNVEYRRLGAGGGWPGSPHDVLTSFDHIRYLDRDHDRVVALSHSAGGQLSTWAAERTVSGVALHVAMSPLLDLGKAVADGDVGAAECQRLLDAGAPSKTLPARVATVWAHAADDQIVPVERSRELAEEAGIELIVPEVDHFTLLDPTKPHWIDVLKLIEESK
jgi:3-dehydroquinate dehydratase-2